MLVTIANLTPKQRELVAFVGKYTDGVHVTDLAEALEIARNEAVYRVTRACESGRAHNDATY